MMKTPLTLFFAALLAAAPAASAGAAKKGKPTLLQKRCFCIQPSDHPVSPYYLGKMDSLPECAALKVEDLGNHDLNDTGLLDCDTVKACLAPAGKNQEKKEILVKKLSEAETNLSACCPKTEPGPMLGKYGEGAPEPNCDQKCSSNWEQIITILKAEELKLKPALDKDIDACLAKAPLFYYQAPGEPAPGKGKKKKAAR